MALRPLEAGVRHAAGVADLPLCQTQLLPHPCVARQPTPAEPRWRAADVTSKRAEGLPVSSGAGSSAAAAHPAAIAIGSEDGKLFPESSTSAAASSAVATAAVKPAAAAAICESADAPASFKSAVRASAGTTTTVSDADRSDATTSAAQSDGVTAAQFDGTTADANTATREARQPDAVTADEPDASAAVAEPGTSRVGTAAARSHRRVFAPASRDHQRSRPA